MDVARAPRVLRWSAAFVGGITALVAVFGGAAVALTVWWAITPAPLLDEVWLVPGTEDRSRAVLDALGVAGRDDVHAVTHVAVERSVAPGLLPRLAGPALAVLVWAGCTLGGLLLYRVLDSAVKGAPFVHDNVRRLRRLALIAVGGAVLAYVAPLVLGAGPLADLPEGVGTAIPIPFLSWSGLLAVAAVSAVLAAVFERGVQLADAEARTI